MPNSTRPEKVGDYELLQDFENDSASIRVIRMEEGLQAVDAHVHQRSAQVYIALVGSVAVRIDGVETELSPYEVASVPIGALHSTRPVDDTAVVMNISIPPLAADDQSPAAAG